MKSVVTVAAMLTAVTACSVSGDPVRTPDLSARIVPSDAFPYGPGLPVQDPGIVSDITFRPVRQNNRPDDCTPVAVDAATAQVRVGPGGPAGGSLTVLVVRAADSFDDFVAQATRCEKFALGGTVGTTVVTAVGDDAPDGALRLERQIIMGPQTAESTPPTSSITEYVAQRGDIRVYVQNRRRGTEALSDAELAATRTLFVTARKAAFRA
ncbi:hypothetical protein ACH46_09195 [Gordonia phthalatica]|uniref:DUF5642 domain-containing protein n=1 Tax=Gordonia phthalatica TaxID=1136941 RepID=A0A0N7FUK8_9ACTN|nr:hypothetical protein ACH46_09195 [Gordonia phthalatica]